MGGDRPVSGRNMDLSIIIINYNTRDLTVACIESVYAYTRDLEVEVIVVDNASTDDSGQVLSSLSYPGYQYVCNQKNLGFSRANNQASRMASGQYLFFMNSDMKLLNNVPGILKHYMEAHSDIGILGPKFLNADMSLQVSCRNFPSLLFGSLKFFPLLGIFLPREGATYYHRGRNFDEIQDVDTVSAGALFISRQLFEAIGRFDTFSFMYAEDADICRRVRDRGFRVVFMPEARLIHYGGQSTALNSSRAVWSYYLAFYHLYKKYYFGHAGVLVKPLFIARALVALVANRFRKDKRITWRDKKGTL